jgi:hypothetical protein
MTQNISLYIAEFLTHDFFGLHVLLDCSRVQHLIVKHSIRKAITSNPGGLLAQFEPLLALKQDWAKSFKLHLDVALEDSNQSDENRHRVLTAVEEVVARAEEGERKGVVIVHCMGRSTSPLVVDRYLGWLADYILGSPRVWLMRQIKNRRKLGMAK